MLAQLQALLRGHPWADNSQYFDSIDSTNSYAKKLAADGAAEGTVIIAGRQTGGRGRLGRSFSSPAGMGIYMSVILRPHCLPEEVMHLTCAAGVAACWAIESATDSCPRIKWTNDLVLGKRKLGGILTEISVNPHTRTVDWAVVGIGINCCQQPQDFPADIRGMACSLGIDQPSIPLLAAALVTEICRMRDMLFRNQAELMKEFSQRCVTIGQEISILRGDEVSHATAVSVELDGGLQVVYPDGRTETITSGEVSIRGMYGYL